MAETDERRYWVWVAAPDRYRTEDGGEHPDLDPATGGTRWCCHRDTRAGDLAVLYRSREAKDIAYRLRAVGDADELREDERAGPGVTHACAAEVLDRFTRPIPLADLKADPVVAAWPALRSGFARGAAPVPPAVWARLMEMAEVDAEPGAGPTSTEISEAERDAERVAAEVEAEIAASDAPATAGRAPRPEVADRRPSPERIVWAAAGALAATVVVAVVVAVVVRSVRRRR